MSFSTTKIITPNILKNCMDFTGGLYANQKVYSEFLFDCEMKHFTQKTMKGYRNNLSRFFKYLDEKYNIQDIEEITARQIKDFFRELWQNGRKVTYTNGLLKTFRAFFKYAVNEEYIITNPCLKVPWGKEPIVLIKTFSDDEVKRMLDVFSGVDYMSVRNKAIIAMLIDTGIHRIFRSLPFKNGELK